MGCTTWDDEVGADKGLTCGVGEGNEAVVGCIVWGGEVLAARGLTEGVDVGEEGLAGPLTCRVGGGAGLLTHGTLEITSCFLESRRKGYPRVWGSKEWLIFRPTRCPRLWERLRFRFLKPWGDFSRRLLRLRFRFFKPCGDFSRPLLRLREEARSSNRLDVGKAGQSLAEEINGGCSWVFMYRRRRVLVRSRSTFVASSRAGQLGSVAGCSPLQLTHRGSQS